MPNTLLRIQKCRIFMLLKRKNVKKLHILGQTKKTRHFITFFKQILTKKSGILVMKTTQLVSIIKTIATLFLMRAHHKILNQMIMRFMNPVLKMREISQNRDHHLLSGQMTMQKMMKMMVLFGKARTQNQSIINGKLFFHSCLTF